MALSDFTYTESAPDSGKGSLGKDGSATRVFILDAWSDLSAFMLSLLRGWIVIGEGVWQYNPGHQHPDYPNMYCESATWEGIGTSSWNASAGRSEWTSAKITATYTPPSQDPKDIFEQSLDFSAEAMSLPGESFSFNTGETNESPVSVGITKVIPTCAYTLTLIDVPSLPGGDATLIFSLLGKLNQDAFSGASPKCALYLGASTDRTVTNQGSKGWKIAQKFMVRPPGFEWTKILNPATGNFEEIKNKAGGLLYDVADLSTLLPGST